MSDLKNIIDELTEDKKIELHPLWAEEYWMLKAFFEHDLTIFVDEPYKDDNGHHCCTIVTNSPMKVSYLEDLLNVRDLYVTIKCENEEISNNEKLAYICKDNDIFYDITSMEDKGVKMFEAVEFEPICMHYYSDDFSSPTGHTAILPWQLAKKLFSGNGINFQTHLVE